MSADDTAEIAKLITKEFDNLQCVPCAKALEQAFKAKGISGEVIELKAGGYYNIWSEASGGVISRNGYHRAVKVGDTVYDNIHKSGVPNAEWIKNFTSAGPKALKKNSKKF